ncbi:hypothetical protein GBAR_LOCUS2273 [Geodia barretti]|uniref:Uncharacterized protein n=1 Tax=Geodia barretti TaxID=519541 RepID=A0AA35W4L2_GEOBA|nr:hypothetical protein GBAR_LOCUS2273 [Geodia barretti]
MMKIWLLLALGVFTSRFYTAKTSYLDVPRIHFRGKYRADVNTRNNCQCNFDPRKELNEDKEWNYKGTSEWEFIDTYITSVVDKEGKEVSKSPLLGVEIFSSDEGPLAKLVDLDVDFQVTTLYGVKFCMRVGGETVLKGDWTPAIIARDVWNRLKCGKPNHPDAVYGAISTSTITNIECPSIIHNHLNLCKELKMKVLSVSISPNYFSGDVFTIGNVVGTIGIAEEGEPVNVGGDRKLVASGQPLQVCPDADPVEDGVNVAPFIYDADRNKLVVDISNAFPADAQNHRIDLGTLWLGVLDDDGALTTFGEPLPYLEPFIWDHGGIVEYKVPKELKKTVISSPVVIVKEIDSDSCDHHVYQHKECFTSLSDSKVMVLLQESEYFVRPTGYYHGRLEYGNDDYDSSQITLLLTSFGKPVKDTVVRVEPHTSIPANGVVALENGKQTNDEGLVTYTFKASQAIPFPRMYKQNPCNSIDCPDRPIHRMNATDQTDAIYQLPIDGQVYHFCYFVDIEGQPTPSCDEILTKVAFFSQVISFLSFSTMFYERPYTWVEHVAPIFEQVHRLYYVMRAVLDLSSYKDVTQPYNKILLKKALSKDINDAGYMPVTRDLSPTKKYMVLEWLERPCFSKLDCVSLFDKCQKPHTGSRLMGEDQYERCGLAKIPSKSHPQMYFSHIYNDEECPTFKLRAERPLRPLFGYASEEEIKKQHPLIAMCSSSRCAMWKI